MTNSITIDMQGERIALNALAEALSRTNQILVELDNAVSSKTTLRWEVSGLRFGSAQVTARPVPIQNRSSGSAEDVLRLFQVGIHALESGAARPPNWSDRALEILKDLATTSNNGEQKLSFVIREGETPPESLSLTGRTIISVDELIDSGKTSFGSVEGTLEILHGLSNYFTILDHATNRRIKCECTTQMLDEIAAGQLWRTRLIVTGEIREDRAGHPKRVKVSDFRPVQMTDKLPEPEDLVGLFRIVGQ